MSIYRSRRGRDALETVYDCALERIAVPVEHRTLDTRFGETHVLLAGPPDGPPLFVFHGGNATNPLTLSWYIDLADTYRLIAPDIIGQPGYSAATRVDPRGPGYGDWVADLLDGFDQDAARMLGTSYGAGIVLRTAAAHPGRIDRTGLVVPAGFGTGSMLLLARVGLPAVLYRYFGTEWLLDRTIQAMVTVPETESLVRETIGASLRHVDLEREFPGAQAAELRGFDAPIACFCGEEDPFFSSSVILPRARDRLERVVRAERLPGEKHILSPAARAKVCERLHAFFRP